MSPWLAEEAAHESRHRALSMTTPELLAYRAAMKRVGGVWRSSAPALAAPDGSVLALSLCADEAGGEVKRHQVRHPVLVVMSMELRALNRARLWMHSMAQGLSCPPDTSSQRQGGQERASAGGELCSQAAGGIGTTRASLASGVACPLLHQPAVLSQWLTDAACQACVIPRPRSASAARRRRGRSPLASPRALDAGSAPHSLSPSANFRTRSVTFRLLPDA